MWKGIEAHSPIENTQTPPIYCCTSSIFRLTFSIWVWISHIYCQTPKSSAGLCTITHICVSQHILDVHWYTIMMCQQIRPGQCHTTFFSRAVVICVCVISRSSVETYIIVDVKCVIIWTNTSGHCHFWLELLAVPEVDVFTHIVEDFAAWSFSWWRAIRYAVKSNRY